MTTTHVDAPILRLTGLTKVYGEVRAVDGIDLEVGAREVLGLLGPNGSGKSTTLNLVLGFLSPTSGRVEVNGYDISVNRGAALKSVGGLVEGAGFYPYLTGHENLRLLARIRRLPERRVDEVLEQVELSGAADRAFGGYSQGMRQRLGVAGALLHDPALLVLDEPTSGLDPAGTRDMRALIPLLAERGHTIVLASHLLHEVEQVCERVAIMKRGRVIARGTVDDLLLRGDRWSVVVRPEDAERATLLLAPFGRTAPGEMPGQIYVDDAGGNGRRLNETLARGGVFASEIHAAQRELEDVFLELTDDVVEAAGA